MKLFITVVQFLKTKLMDFVISNMGAREPAAVGGNSFKKS